MLAGTCYLSRKRKSSSIVLLAHVKRAKSTRRPADLSVFLKGVASPYGYVQCDIIQDGERLGLLKVDETREDLWRFKRYICRVYTIDMDKNPQSPTKPAASSKPQSVMHQLTLTLQPRRGPLPRPHCHRARPARHALQGHEGGRPGRDRLAARPPDAQAVFAGSALFDRRPTAGHPARRGFGPGNGYLPPRLELAPRAGNLAATGA